MPLSVPGLKLWVRTESLAALSDTEEVAAWPDESGNGRDLVQAVAAKRPVMQEDETIGRAVLFDGADDVLATAANVLNTDRHTFFLVARPLATTSNDLFSTGGTGNGDVLLMLYGDGLRGHLWRGVQSNLTDGSPQIHDAAFAIFEQEATATDLILRLNGIQDASQALVGTPASASKPVYLGSRNNSWFFHGWVRAFLVYEGNPSAEDKARLREYLMATYAIPTPYPPPAAPGAPVNLDGGPDGADASLWWDMSNAHYATGVEVESKPDGAPDSSYAVIATLGVEAEFVDAGIGPAATTYRVRAFNAGGYSAYSNTVTITF